MAKNFVITIARGFGSGGKEIALKVAEKLGIPCYERQILQMASDYSGLTESVFAEVDERLRGGLIAKALEKFSFPKELVPQNKRFEGDIRLFELQRIIIRELAKKNSCVIVGKCADFILRDFDNVGSFYIEAPRKQCLESIMNKTGVSEKEAAKLIETTDKYRADYYKFYSGGNYWTNPINYDATLNSARIGREKCADVIIKTMKIKFGDDFSSVRSNLC